MNEIFELLEKSKITLLYYDDKSKDIKNDILSKLHNLVIKDWDFEGYLRDIKLHNIFILIGELKMIIF